MLTSALDYLKQNYEYELCLRKVSVPVITEIPALRFQEAKQMISEEFHREIKDMEDFEPEEEKLLSELIKSKTGSEFVL